MPAGRPKKFETPEALQEQIDAYFKDCEARERPYTITGLALWLDTDRDTLLDYKNGKHGQEYSDSYKAALLKCHNFAEERLYGTGQVTGVIFSLKNNYGWKDKTEVDSNVNMNARVDLSKLPDEELSKIAGF